MGPLELRLKNKIESALSPEHFELENESHSHSVPVNSETHFRAVIVSRKFEGISRIIRQRTVLEAIADEMQGGVHAFTMRCLTPEEWNASSASQAFVSPPCHGGSKSSRKA